MPLIHSRRTAGARCLVLGGGGFIGTNLCNALTRSGAHVHAYGRRLSMPDCFDHGVRWTQADMRDRATLKAAVATADIVFHLVSSNTPATANSDPIVDATDNLVATLQLLEICRASAVRCVVFVSSGGTVYGIPTEIPIPESAPTEPITAYGIQKLAIEKYLAAYHHQHGLDYRILRLANPYGPYQLASKNQGVVAALMLRAMNGEPLEIWGTGETVRDFVFVDDAIRAIILATEYTGPLRLFNVGSGTGVSINSLVDDIEEIVDRGKLKRIYRPGRPFDVPANVLDIRRIGAEIGWVPEVPLSDGLRATSSWLLTQFPASRAPGRLPAHRR